MEKRYILGNIIYNTCSGTKGWNEIENFGNSQKCCREVKVSSPHNNKRKFIAF